MQVLFSYYEWIKDRLLWHILSACWITFLCFCINSFFLSSDVIRRMVGRYSSSHSFSPQYENIFMNDRSSLDIYRLGYQRLFGSDSISAIYSVTCPFECPYRFCAENVLVNEYILISFGNICRSYEVKIPSAVRIFIFNDPFWLLVSIPSANCYLFSPLELAVLLFDTVIIFITFKIASLFYTFSSFSSKNPLRKPTWYEIFSLDIST